MISISMGLAQGSGGVPPTLLDPVYREADRLSLTGDAEATASAELPLSNR